MKTFNIEPSVNESRLLDHAHLCFSADASNVGAEMLQNALRSGSKELMLQLSVKDGGLCLTIADYGRGCYLPDLFELSTSNWSEEVMKQSPAGMGFYSLLGLVAEHPEMRFTVSTTHEMEGQRLKYYMARPLNNFRVQGGIEAVEEATDGPTGFSCAVWGDDDQIMRLFASIYDCFGHSMPRVGVDPVVCKVRTTAAARELIIAWRDMNGKRYGSSNVRVDCLMPVWTSDDVVEVQEGNVWAEFTAGEVWADLIPGVDVHTFRTPEKYFHRDFYYAGKQIEDTLSSETSELFSALASAMHSDSRGPNMNVSRVTREGDVVRVNTAHFRDLARVFRVVFCIRDTSSLDLVLPARDQLSQNTRTVEAITKLKNLVFEKLYEPIRARALRGFPEETVLLSAVESNYQSYKTSGQMDVAPMNALNRLFNNDIQCSFWAEDQEYLRYKNYVRNAREIIIKATETQKWAIFGSEQAAFLRRAMGYHPGTRPTHLCYHGAVLDDALALVGWEIGKEIEFVTEDDIRLEVDCREDRDLEDAHDFYAVSESCWYDSCHCSTEFPVQLLLVDKIRVVYGDEAVEIDSFRGFIHNDELPEVESTWYERLPRKYALRGDVLDNHKEDDVVAHLMIATEAASSGVFTDELSPMVESCWFHVEDCEVSQDEAWELIMSDMQKDMVQAFHVYFPDTYGAGWNAEAASCLVDEVVDAITIPAACMRNLTLDYSPPTCAPHQPVQVIELPVTLKIELSANGMHFVGKSLGDGFDTPEPLLKLFAQVEKDTE